MAESMPPTEPRVQGVPTPSLIDQTLSIVEQSLHQLVANQKDVPSPPPVQEQQTASGINQTLSMVAVAVSGSTVPEAQKPVTNRTASLIAEALSMVKGVAVTKSKPVEVESPTSFKSPETKAAEVAPFSSQERLAKTLTKEERLEMGRADMRNRAEAFKANQQRFQREREEYYEATMAKARARLD
jgi:hypothetical protein